MLQAIVFVPFVLPPIMTGLSLLIFFREAGLPRSLVTVTIGHTVFVLALVYRIVLARLESLSPSLIEASYDLGGEARAPSATSSCRTSPRPWPPPPSWPSRSRSTRP